MGTTVSKNKTAKVKTKSGNEYSYRYVDIAQVHEYLESINAKYIQKIQRIDDDDYIFTKRCFDNNWEEEWLQGSKVVDATLFGTDNPAQKQGSALTYARRYSLLMAFGLATEDDDAQSLSETSGKQEIKATGKQITMLLKYYQGENLAKLLNICGIEKIEDMPLKKASELIGACKKREEEKKNGSSEN